MTFNIIFIYRENHGASWPCSLHRRPAQAKSHLWKNQSLTLVCVTVWPNSWSPDKPNVWFVWKRSDLKMPLGIVMVNATKVIFNYFIRGSFLKICMMIYWYFLKNKTSKKMSLKFVRNEMIISKIMYPPKSLINFKVRETSHYLILKTNLSIISYNTRQLSVLSDFLNQFIF